MPRAGSGSDSASASGLGCPVCHDGQADPWAIIRDIRSVLRLQGVGGAVIQPEPTPKVDRFATEWPLLEVSVRAIWSDITPDELVAVEQDRDALEALLRKKYGYGPQLAHQLCTGVEELHERFNGQWEVIRECVPQYWSEVAERDVATMAGTMSELAGLVGRRYSMSTEDARAEVAKFLEEIDYRMLVRLFGTTQNENDQADVGSRRRADDAEHEEQVVAS